MKCPYQTITTHQPKYTDLATGAEYFAADYISFNVCLEKECPFYYKTSYFNGDNLNVVKEHCRRAESEVKNAD